MIPTAQYPKMVDPRPLSALNDYFYCQRRVALKFIEDQHPGYPVYSPRSARIFPMIELDPKHRPLAPPAGGDQAPPPLGNHPDGRGAEHGLRGRTGAAGDDPRDTRPNRATRFVDEARQRVNGLHAGAGPQRKRTVAGGGCPFGRRLPQTTRGLLSYAALAPLLAERVAFAEAALASGRLLPRFRPWKTTAAG